jgi:hypothetical protein
VPTSPLYPGAVRNFGSDVVNFTDTILAEHVNYLRAEVNSIETVLGTYLTLSSGFVGSFTEPSISYTWDSLKDRLANIEYGLHVAYAAKTPTGGATGQVLVKNSSSDYDFSWTTGNFLPTQSSGTNGQYLKSNGSTASWATVAGDIESVTAGTGLTGGGISGAVTLNLDTTSAYVVPSQSGANGKYLTSNGSTASWATVASTGGANEFVLMMMGA